MSALPDNTFALGDLAAGIVDRVAAGGSSATNYAYWFARLRGEDPGLGDNPVLCGHWRRQRREDGAWEPISVWRNDVDDVVAKIGLSGRVVECDEAFVERVMAWCVRHPVGQAAFDHYAEHGRWPDEVAAPPRNHNAPLEVQIAESRGELRSEFDAWLKSIGGAVTTQEHETKATAFRNRFAKLEEEAETSRKSEKDQHQRAARAVDAKWSPVRDACQADKRLVASTCESFRKERQAKVAAAAMAKAKAGAVVHPTEMIPKGGTGLRRAKIGEIEDYDAFIAAVKDWQEVKTFFAGLASRIAKGTNAVPTPGVKVSVIQKAA